MQRTSPIKFALLSILFLTPLACGGSDAASPSGPESSTQQTANGERVEHSHGAENTDALPTDGSHSSTSGEPPGQPNPTAIQRTSLLKTTRRKQPPRRLRHLPKLQPEQSQPPSAFQLVPVPASNGRAERQMEVVTLVDLIQSMATP